MFQTHPEVNRLKVKSKSIVDLMSFLTMNFYFKILREQNVVIMYILNCRGYKAFIRLAFRLHVAYLSSQIGIHL